jgi:hypothetical protein
MCRTHTWDWVGVQQFAVEILPGRFQSASSGQARIDSAASPSAILGKISHVVVLE